MDARIHVYDGRLWVDRGGGDAEGAVENEAAVVSDQRQTDVESRHERQKESLSTATMSQLLVDKAQMFHSGRYVCSALGASGTWTLVHILAGKTKTKSVYSILFIPLFLIISASFVLFIHTVANSDGRFRWAREGLHSRAIEIRENLSLSIFVACVRTFSSGPSSTAKCT